MASIVSTAIGAGALGLIYGIAGAPDNVVKTIASDSNKSAKMIDDCNACISYLNRLQTDTSTLLEDDEKVAMEKCALIRDLPADKLESTLRKMLTTANAAKLSEIATTCRTAINSSATQTISPGGDDDPDKTTPTETPPTENVTLFPAEEELYTQFASEWTDMSSFDCTSDSDSDVDTGIDPMTIRDVIILPGP
tara:strand:- start:15 stop:596 length:582 start_codon:yes stop_codon:yes gene_type:complete